MTSDELADIRKEALDEFTLMLKSLIEPAMSIKLDPDKKMKVGHPGSCHPFSPTAIAWHESNFAKKFSLYVVRTFETKSGIADKIRESRKKRGLSQEEFAELTSVSLGTIKFLEENQRAPSLPMLLKILCAVGRDARIWE